MLVRYLFDLGLPFASLLPRINGKLEYKEAFALFDKRGTGFVPREQIGDLLRALGQNPTQGEVAEIASNAPREVDYKTFLAILNRPDGFKPAGTPGKHIFTCLYATDLFMIATEEFIRGFQVFDKEGNGFIGAGELRYVLTQLGEKMTDEEVDELLKGVQIGPYVNSTHGDSLSSLLPPETETTPSFPEIAEKVLFLRNLAAVPLPTRVEVDKWKKLNSSILSSTFTRNDGQVVSCPMRFAAVAPGYDDLGYCWGLSLDHPSLR
ncbi:myosin regulatory light chain cdc4 [Rhizoctonia solani AG-1 IA]|uniref:Myosin regulatory light chain cdc4 n=1 Tax=Thanatephorus cucumeris (strain AG1-IA) TaxID=983506 RepID=L8WPA7_THACA|nr:myosin regulatory light chain cdc4 [Rhizoctonia solani AG-1 IA]